MTSLYIHIPFCKKKCNYCDFVSYAGKEELMEEYVEALTKEIQRSAFHFPLSTIYIGGGTPTLLEPKHYESLISNFECRISNIEVTIEANPGTANKHKLKELRQLGINRISIGAQSFSNHHLQTLGRIHTSEDIFRFYDNARSAGFENINLDLIFALPDQTLEQWKNDLQTAISLNPEHLSTYNLQIEENTYLFEVISKSKIPNEEEELAMYEYAIETLTDAGYKHYEISNFARPGFECQHNINYWKNGNYLGIGAGAHSHVDGKRWANPDSIEAFMRQEPGEAGNEMRNALRKTPDNSHFATAQRETIFLGLRLLEGLAIEKFRGLENEVTELIENSLLIRENGHYKLTRRGLYLGNEVFAKFV